MVRHSALSHQFPFLTVSDRESATKPILHIPHAYLVS